MPICTKCRGDLPVQVFMPDKRTKTGLAKVCTPCRKGPFPRFAFVYYPRRLS